MPRPKTIPQIPLPKGWSTQVKSAVVHVIALAQYALIYSCSWAADGSNQRVRLRAECDRLEQEVSWLAGQDSHLLETDAFSRHTDIWDFVREFSPLHVWVSAICPFLNDDNALRQYGSEAESLGGISGQPPFFWIGWRELAHKVPNVVTRSSANIGTQPP